MSERKVVGKERKCSANGCDERHFAQGVCKKHYAQILRHGRLTPERERGPIGVCLAEGCDRRASIRRYCRRHARQIRLHGRLTPDREHVMGSQGCRVAGCKEPHIAKGLCMKHYASERRRRMDVPVRRKRPSERG